MQLNVLLLMLLTTMLCSAACALPNPGTSGVYRVLTGMPEVAPPYEEVKIIYGGTEAIDGEDCVWWQLEVRQTPGAQPLMLLRALTSGDPLAGDSAPVEFRQYILRVPETGDTLSYRNVNTGGVLLPGWKDFEKYFIPHRAKGCREQDGMPNTVTHLGHTLTLQSVDKGASWEKWDDVRVLNLDPELMIGTGRHTKDAEGHRLPSGQNYTYVKFTGEDYRLMIDTGFSLFTIAPEQEQFVRAEPVFYIRGVKGDPALRYPADLYRSNYLGSVMFLDEPTMRLTGDEHIHNTLKYFSDFASVIKQRVDWAYRGSGSYGAYNLQKQLDSTKVNTGDMRLMQWDYPSWETALETTFYQMEGGCNGLVHEGRYNLAGFADEMKRWTGIERTYSPEDYLRYQYALLRGGTNTLGKHWGMSIYGQADPKLSPLAVTLAYDMGARYIWFWTSDHDHHLPWNEQIELVNVIKKHQAKHPRATIFGTQPKRDTAIAIPYGYFLFLPHLNGNPHANLWWVRELDLDGKNESSQRYQRVMERAHKAVIEALEKGEEFDITVDDGREIAGYKRVVRINDSE